MANKTFHIPKSAIVKTEDNVSILEGKQQTITTDASAVATLTNTDGFKAAHYSIAAERDGEVTTTTTTTTTTVTGSGTSIDADTKLLLNANYIYDESFSKKDITLNNTEVVRKGYAFDGSDSISIADSDDFHLGTDDFTLEAWINFSSTQNCWIMNQAQSNSNAWAFGYQSGELILKFANGNWASPAVQISESWSPTTGVWYHVAVSREGNDFKLWIDGSQLGSTVSSSNGSDNMSANLVIGKYGFSSAGFFDGYMSDIRISKGTARYTADFDEVVTTKDSNHKLILTGETTDQSDSSHTLTFNGNAHPTAKYGQGSFYFDGGSSSWITVPKDSSMSYANKSFAMEAWVMLEDYPSSYGAIFGDSKPSYGIEVALNSTGYIFAWIGNGSWITNSDNQSYNPGGSAPTLGGPQLSKGTWYHVAITFDGSAYRLFVNGALSQTYTTTTSTYWGTDTDLNIGTIRSSNSYVVNGYVSDFRLSVGTARYTAAFNNDLPTAPLETEDSRTKLLLNTNSALQDFEIGRMALAPTYAGDTKVVRRGYAFDGSDKITIASSSDFSFGTGDFTVEMWFYQKDTNASSTQRGVFQLSTISGGLAGGTRAGGIFINTGVHAGGTANNQGMRCIIGNSEAIIGTSTAAVKLNAWNHVVVSRESGTARFFLNGELLDSESSSENITGTNMVLGGYHSDSYLMNGYMSDIRITKGEAVYTSAFTPPQSLTAGTNTKLLLTGGESDESSSEHSLTFSGAYPTAKFGDGSYYFDGTGDEIICDPSPISGTDDFTIEFWSLKTEDNSNNGSSGYDPVIASNVGGGNLPDWIMEVSTQRGFIFYYYNSGTYGYEVSDSTLGNIATDGEWHHYAFVRESGVFKLYVDGTYYANTSTTYTTSTTHSLLDNGTITVGSYTWTDNSNWRYKGYLDDIRISKGVARYTGTNPGAPTSELGGGTNTTTSTETTTTTTTGSSDVVLTKVHLVHDGSNVYFTEYGRTATDDDFLELSASYDAGVAKLHASTTSGSATLELTKKEFDFSAD